MDVKQALQIRHVDADVRDLAHRAPGRIPDQADGTAKLLEEYLTRPCAGFTRTSIPSSMMRKIAGTKLMTARRWICFPPAPATS
jgi:hypothetical protein